MERCVYSDFAGGLSSRKYMAITASMGPIASEASAALNDSPVIAKTLPTAIGTSKLPSCQKALVAPAAVQQEGSLFPY